jgi:hypothetical protein
MTGRQLEVTTTVELNKQDVVTVAMAKIEMHIRKNVRESKKKIGELEQLISEAENEIKALSKAGIPKAMKTKQEKLDKGIKAAGIKDINVNITVQDLSSRHSTNYLLVLDGSSNHITVETAFIDYTKAQMKLVDSIKEMKKQKDAIAEDAVRWKSKLSDMTALERQMRAKVVESELSKTKDGKALIAVLTKDYEETVNLLEM